MAVSTRALGEAPSGILPGGLHFHYDAESDVLYLRDSARLAVEAVGEETDEGVILLRGTEDDSPVGMTLANWWTRFGDRGPAPRTGAQLVPRLDGVIAMWERASAVP